METKVIITGNGYTALVPNGSFPPPAQVREQPSLAEHLLPLRQARQRPGLRQERGMMEK